MTFSEKLLYLRNSKGMTQSELGRVLSVTPQAISKWENALSEPDLYTVKRIAAFFGITLDSLLSDEVSVLPLSAVEAAIEAPAAPAKKKGARCDKRVVIPVALATLCFLLSAAAVAFIFIILL